MIEKYLIGHCSPTLASLKTANLMNIPFENMTQLESSINKTNDELNNKGVELIILKKSDKSALVYAFRKSRLQNDLNQSGVKDFLADYGYKSIDVDCCIKRLKSRLKSSDSFPHEIGIFLGYPLADVKVYCNECEAIKTFKKFEKCKKVYQKLWLQGRSIAKLTVAA